jgi:hypothetical protein
MISMSAHVNSGVFATKVKAWSLLPYLGDPTPVALSASRTETSAYRSCTNSEKPARVPCTPANAYSLHWFLSMSRSPAIAHQRNLTAIIQQALSIRYSFAISPQNKGGKFFLRRH